MTHKKTEKVVFVSSILTHYRRKFHEYARDMLAAENVDYCLVYSKPYGAEVGKKDTIDLPWAQRVPSNAFGDGQRILMQYPWRPLLGAKLIIIGQENRLLLNYPLLMLPRKLRPIVAFWGHGRNFQSRTPDGRAERWKRYWATKVDWWFGYTDETRCYLESLGFPAAQITTFNNSVDTSELRRQVESVTPGQIEQLRGELGLAGRNVGVFVGGIYPDKRLPFLVEAAEIIRTTVPDFEMIVIGGGSELPIVQELARSRPWLHVMGPRFGQEKVELMMLGHVFMMPGLMGLAILDAAVAGLPIATTAFPWHSPEIAYLDPGQNGLKVQEWDSPAAYGRAVSELLLDSGRLEAMGRAAREMANRFSIEAMAENFARGVLKALAR